MGQNSVSQGEWMPLGTTSPAALRDARLQIHWAAQVVSSLGKTFIRPRPDDSHPNFGYMPDGGLLVSHETETAPSFRAALAIPTNSLLLLDERHVRLDETDLEGMTFEDAFGWLERAVDTHSSGAVKGPLNRTLYDIPDHPVGAGEPFQRIKSSELAELRAWYHDADLLLGEFVSRTDGATDVRTWPHHFDIGALVLIDREGDPETARSVGVGMTPGDSYYGEPYFYVNPYPRPSPDQLPALSGGGIWHEQDWIGAVLRGSELASVHPSQQLGSATSYLNMSFETARGLLRRQ